MHAEACHRPQGTLRAMSSIPSLRTRSKHTCRPRQHTCDLHHHVTCQPCAERWREPVKESESHHESRSSSALPPKSELDSATEDSAPPIGFSLELQLTESCPEKIRYEEGCKRVGAQVINVSRKSVHARRACILMRLCTRVSYFLDNDK
jgi:hypothetical protein